MASFDDKNSKIHPDTEPEVSPRKKKTHEITRV